MLSLWVVSEQEKSKDWLRGCLNLTYVSSTHFFRKVITVVVGFLKKCLLGEMTNTD